MLNIKSSLLGACLILFFLPFVEIKCNEENLVNASAMELAFARPLKLNTPEMLEQYLGENSEMSEAMNAINSEKRKPDVLLIAYLICLVAGFVLVDAPKPKLQAGSAVASLLAFLSLIGFYFVYKKGWEDNVSGELGSIPMVSLSLHFCWALWLSMMLLVGAIAIQIATFLSERKDRQLEIYEPSHNYNTEVDQEPKKDNITLWKEARFGILLFCAIHFIFEVLTESGKIGGISIFINYSISAWYVKRGFSKGLNIKNTIMFGLATACIVFLIRLVLGMIVYFIITK